MSTQNNNKHLQYKKISLYWLYDTRKATTQDCTNILYVRYTADIYII